MASIFTKILAGEIPCNKILENDEFFSFLDIRPIAKGHTLVIPKKEIDYIFDLDQNLLTGIMPFASKVADALKKTIPCKRIGIMVAGLEVPHAHIHLVPMIESVHELNFANAKDVDPKELKTLSEEIKSHL